MRTLIPIPFVVLGISVVHRDVRIINTVDTTSVYMDYLLSNPFLNFINSFPYFG